MGCNRLVIARKRDLAGVPTGLGLLDKRVDQQIVEKEIIPIDKQLFAITGDLRQGVHFLGATAVVG
jgi:hypothetical protein